jgi:hypothetical protein
VALSAYRAVPASGCVVVFEACVCHMGRGKNVYERPGSIAHESFIYNVAHGRLDAYTFDLWNMNQCLCADPQPSMDFCRDGFYRWSINAIAWTHNVSSQFGRSVPKFDEPAVSLGWTKTIGPHRSAMVGESLFVHCQFTKQRMGNVDYGLKEPILLPWYYILMQQYTAQPYGAWAGNTTLHHLYEQMAFDAGERRFRA